MPVVSPIPGLLGQASKVVELRPRLATLMQLEGWGAEPGDS